MSARTILPVIGLSWVLATTSSPGATRYVSPTGGQVSPYTEWSTAARRIQDAIDACSNGDRVILEIGTYYECINLRNKDIELVSRFEESGNPAHIEQTVVDGSFSNTVIIITNGQTAATRVSGFTVQRGWAKGVGPYEQRGGGIRAQRVGAQIENMIIRDCRSAVEGGGVYTEYGTPVLRNTLVSNNRTDSGGNGGGIRTSYGDPSFLNVSVVNNEAQAGGGVFLYHGNPYLRNCLIADNVATGEGGGAMYFDGCSPEIVNCTIANNRAPGDGEGGGLNVSYMSHPRLVNSILWGNTPQQVHFNADWFGMAITFDYSDLQGGVESIVTLGKGPVNWSAGISENPSFAGAQDYRVSGDSPCVNAGVFQTWMSGAADLDGLPRIEAGAVDMGAYEYHGETSPSIPTHYVSPGGDNVAPYTNWTTAAWRIQDAIHAAGNGARVLVGRGRYVENINFRGKNIRVESLFADTGNEAYIAQTVIDGNHAGPAVTLTNHESAASLKGFTIINGNASGPVNTMLQRGGGILCYKASPLLSHLVVTGNFAQVVGGGMYFEEANATVRHVIVSGNISTEHSGGGLGIYYCSPLIENARIENNRAVFVDGGGIQMYHANPTLRNVLVANNSAGGKGGGLFFDDADAMMVNMTVAGNTAAKGGGLNVSYSSAPTLQNCIVWSNGNNEIEFDTTWFGMSLYVNHSIVRGGSNGVVTHGKGPVTWISSSGDDPLFAGAGDFSPAGGSPCINAGVNQSWMETATDLSGLARISLGVVDLGAFEYHGGATVTVSTPATPATAKPGVLTGVSVSFTTGGSTSSDGGPVQYRFGWDDGSVSAWGDAAAVHTWAAPGTYNVRAQARSVYSPGFLSEWSDPFNLTVSNPQPATRYVSKVGDNTPPYTNWANAARRIQDALDICVNGDRVIMDVGTYYECITFGNKDIELVSRFEESRDPSYIEQTIIDGAFSNTVIVVTNGQTAATRLSGFTVQHGWGHGSGVYDIRGGGIRAQRVNALFENLVIQDCWSAGEGGGFYTEHGSPLVRNTTIRGNVAQNTGGGGGIRVSYGNPAFINVAVIGNEAQSGGGVFLYHGVPSLRNCLIVDNVATGEGGGALYFDGCSPEIVNCTIANNRAPGDGEGGGLNVSYMSHPKLVNSILWGNTPQQVYFNADWFGMAITFDYSDLQGGVGSIVTLGKGPVNWSPNCIVTDPLFSTANTYALQPESPCRDTGTNQPWMSAATDLSGRPRIHAGIVDMGAYEYTPLPEPLGCIRVELLPGDVRTLGAAWRIATGPETNWQESGASIWNLPAGDYVVTFFPLSGWISPPDIPVTISGNDAYSLSGVYEPTTADDRIPPVIVAIWPPDGYVTVSNKLWMTIVVTDNVAVASVRVNDDLAARVSEDTYRYEVKPLNGHYHLQTVVATDVFGNKTTTEVIYAQSGKYRLTAIWNGYWRVRNPFDEDFRYLWEVKQNPAEHGSGVCPAHSDDYFNTSLGEKHVVLMDTNRNIVDEKGWSPQEPAYGMADAFVDSDLDGVSNMDEDIAGSDPENAGSVFALHLAGDGLAEPLRSVFSDLMEQELDAAALLFSWESSTNALYTLEASTNIFLWTPVQNYTRIAGTGDTMSYTNPPHASSVFFLRIWAERP